MTLLNTAAGVYVGGVAAKKVYAGTQLVWAAEIPSTAGPRNSFMGIPSGTAVTTGNSGGVSGTAFDVVSGSCVVNTSADLTDAYDRGVVVSLSASTASYMAWTVPDSVDSYGRLYLRVAALPSATVRLARGYSGGTIRWELRLSTAGKLMLTNEAGQTMVESTGSLAAGTIYRVEWRPSSTSPQLRYNVGGVAGSLATTSYGNTVSTGTWTQVRIGQMVSSAQTYSLDMAALGVAPDGWIGG